MNEGMFNAIRTHLAELTSTQQEIRVELRRTNELLAQLLATKTEPTKTTATKRSTKKADA